MSRLLLLTKSLGPELLALQVFATNEAVQTTEIFSSARNVDSDEGARTRPLPELPHASQTTLAQVHSQAHPSSLVNPGWNG